MMLTVQKVTAGILMGILGWFAPVQSLICCALVFVAIDFVTGVWAGWKRAQRNGHYWRFESAKAWKTIYKLVFILVGIILSWLIDLYILSFAHLNLANIFTGFVCGVEFWSYLENAAEISQHPIFRAVKNVLKERVNESINDKQHRL